VSIVELPEDVLEILDMVQGETYEEKIRILALVPFVFVLSLIGSLIGALFFKSFSYLFLFIILTYLAVNIFFSFKQALKYGLKYFIPLVLSFSTLHFSYGLGSISGVFKLIMPIKEKREDVFPK